MAKPVTITAQKAVNSNNPEAGKRIGSIPVEIVKDFGTSYERYKD